MRNVYLLLLPASNLGLWRRIMPIGPLVVAGSIRRSPHLGKDDRVYICGTFREVLARAEGHRHDRLHLLLSSMQIMRGFSPPVNHAIVYADRFKRLYPGAFRVVGGPDVTLNREAYPSHFDLVYQGEIGSVDLLDVIRSGAPFFQAPAADLSAEPVDYALLTGKKYLAGSLQVSRGCLFDCSFCNISHLFGRGVRTVDPGVLDARLESLAKVHRGFVIIGDDHFAGGREIVMREYLDVILRFQKRRGFPFAFALQTSLQTARFPEILGRMREANIAAVYLGVETPSAEALSAADKRHNLGGPPAEQIEAFIRNGIIPYLSLMFGLDREAIDAGRRMREFLDACRSPFIMLNMLIPVKGSKFRERAAAEGRLLDNPLYTKYNLMPFKTDRPYEDVVRDYCDTLKWFFRGRRLLRSCDHIQRQTAEKRKTGPQDAFAAGLSLRTMLMAFSVYCGLCLTSGTPAGLLGLFTLIGRSKADIFYFLAIRGVALGGKGTWRLSVRQVRKGMDKLRAAGLYPFENTANPGNIKNIT